MLYMEGKYIYISFSTVTNGLHITPPRHHPKSYTSKITRKRCHTVTHAKKTNLLTRNAQQTPAKTILTSSIKPYL